MIRTFPHRVAARLATGLSLTVLLTVLITGSAAGTAAAATAPAVLLGNQSVASLADGIDPGQAEAFPFVAGTSGVSQSVSLYLDTPSDASTAIVGIYSDAGGQPDALLAQGETSSPAAGAWNSIAVDAVNLVAGDTYWVTVLAQGGTLAYRDSSSGNCSSSTSSQTNLSALPASWTSGTTWPTCSISAYVTGTAATSTSPPPAPVNNAPPTISGTAQQGATLTTSNGSWTNNPTSFGYQWQSCDTSGLNCSDITGARSSSYTLTAADVGNTILSVVTAGNASGSASQASSPTAVVAPPPVVTPPPPPQSSGTTSIWAASAVPTTLTASDSSAVELGLKFQSAAATTVTGVRFYKSQSNTGTHTGSLWSSSGQRLATVTFTNESASGWQEADFANPVSIAANTTYTVSYHTDSGHYSADPNYFASGGVTNDGLTALSDSAANGNGVYSYGGSAFPTQSYEAMNYWVDVVVSDAGSGTTTPPTPPADTTAPTIPTGLQAAANSSTSVGLNWTASTDSTGVTGYDVYRDGKQIATTATTSYTDSTVAAATTYTYTVDAYDAAGNTSAQTAGVPVTTPAAPQKTIFSDDFAGTSLGSAWTVISRHGEYAQSETECNVPQEVSVANNVLDIATVAQNTTCGDFNLDGSVRHSPGVWPYATGDVQWSKFNFTYGTVTYRAKFPPANTGTWPAIWLLGSNCQATNPLTADVGYSSCPALQTPGYVETDMTECYGGNWCQLATAQPSGFKACEYPVDSNWHTFSLIWTASAISMTIDGKPTGCSYTKAAGYSIPSTPMFLIIQTQTGGLGGTPANLPAHLQVSDVTVTQP